MLSFTRVAMVIVFLHSNWTVSKTTPKKNSSTLGKKIIQGEGYLTLSACFVFLPFCYSHGHLKFNDLYHLQLSSVRWNSNSISMHHSGSTLYVANIESMLSFHHEPQLRNHCIFRSVLLRGTNLYVWISAPQFDTHPIKIEKAENVCE